MEIRSDIHLIEGKASNFYLVVDADGLTLIDAGMPNEEDKVFELVERLGYHPQHLLRILITHADIDHVGSLAAVQSATGAVVYAGPETAQLLTTGKSPKHLPFLIQWIATAFIKYKPVSKNCIEIIQDGDTLPVMGGLTALSTPGHTNDHFSFYSAKEGVLFAGDAIHTRDGTLKRTEKRITADEEEANQSAINLAQLAPATFACGHGKPISNHDMSDLTQFFNTLR